MLQIGLYNQANHIKDKMADISWDQNAYKKAEAALEARRARARRELEARRAEAYWAVPALLDVEGEISSVGIKYNRALLSGELPPDAVQADLDREIGALKERRESLLLLNGFPDDFLSLAPECALCGDTGYVAGQGGLPERCACFRRLLVSGLVTASNVLTAGEAGFELFDEALYSAEADEARYKNVLSPRENIITIRDRALGFIEMFKDGERENLYFFGRSGTGKTFMAASIANELMRAGVVVLYLSAPSLFSIFTEHRLRAARDEDYRDSLYRQVFASELLVIDDFGTESMTDSRYSEFVTLLNERLSPGLGAGSGNVSGCRFSTILSTNMDLQELRGRYDERILSRIVGSFRLIRFFGEDIRLARLHAKTPSG